MLYTGDVDVRVQLQRDRSNHIDIDRLIRHSNGVFEPGLLKPDTSESPARFRAVYRCLMNKAPEHTTPGPNNTSAAVSSKPRISTLDADALKQMTPEEFLSVAETHSVKELAQVLSVMPTSVTRRIKRYIIQVAAKQGQPEVEFRRKFDDRRFANGVITRASLLLAAGATFDGVAKQRGEKRKRAVSEVE